MDRLTKARILDALRALADELGGRATQVRVGVVGGAALVVLYDARESTKDVDAFVISGAEAQEVRDAANRVASRVGLPEDWLNDAAKGYVIRVAPGPTLFESSSLLVQALAPEQLLGMKLSAWRDDVDVQDAQLLLSHLNGERETVWATVEPYIVPGRELKARYAFEDLWEARHGDS